MQKLQLHKLIETCAGMEHNFCSKRSASSSNFLFFNSKFSCFAIKHLNALAALLRPWKFLHTTLEFLTGLWLTHQNGLMNPNNSLKSGSATTLGSLSCRSSGGLKQLIIRSSEEMQGTWNYVVVVVNVFVCVCVGMGRSTVFLHRLWKLISGGKFNCQI